MSNTKVETEKKSQIGDRMVRSISDNGMLGIRIGADRYHFSEDVPEPDIEIEGRVCKLKPSPSFWNGGCPEIRVAKDESGKNRLSELIEINNLLPPVMSEKLKGKVDKVVIEVINPYKRFKLDVQ
ncbi:MAG TPA: hypothetical protein VF360_07340 [Candidatus Methanoperedens sp.]